VVKKILRVIWFGLLIPFYLQILFLLCVIVLVEILLALVFTLTWDEIVKKYTRRQMVSTDQTINALFAGDEDETISSRTGRAYSGTWIHKLINLIFHWQDDHCTNAIEEDEGYNDIIKPRAGAKK
jgi:hypothetical protein